MRKLLWALALPLALAGGASAGGLATVEVSYTPDGLCVTADLDGPQGDCVTGLPQVSLIACTVEPGGEPLLDCALTLT